MSLKHTLILTCCIGLIAGCKGKKEFEDDELKVERKVYLEYRDSATDSTLLKYGGRYNPDSVAIKTMGKDSSFEVVWNENQNKTQERIPYNYLYLFPVPTEDISTYYFADTAIIKLSNTEFDTLICTKTTASEIRMYYNGNLIRTLDPADVRSPTLVFKR